MTAVVRIFGNVRTTSMAVDSAPLIQRGIRTVAVVSA
jgi:hypothetical protein